MPQRIEDLTTSVDSLTNEASKIRTELRKRTRALWAAMAVGGVVLAFTVVAAFEVSLGNQRAIDDSNKRWCPVVQPLLLRPGDPTPPTDRGKRIVVAFTQLYHEFDCP